MLIFPPPFPLQIFKGNTRSRAIVKNYLQHNITTRYIRIVPVEWNVEIALRVEFYGCDGKTNLFYLNSMIPSNVHGVQMDPQGFLKLKLDVLNQYFQ